MSRQLVRMAGLVLTLAGLCAQSQLGYQDDERTRADVARARREAEQKRSEVDRLVDTRLRHALGLPVEEETNAPRPPGPVTTESRERLQREWRDQDLATSSLLERYNRAKALVDELRAAAAKQPIATTADEGLVVVPQAGTAQPSQVPQPQDAVDNARGAGTSAIPLRAAASTVLTELDPTRGLIQGSSDHLRVAQALFKAGQELADLADSARRVNRAEEAKELDRRAKERLVLAIDELAPLLAAKEPAFAVLFYQGRCRELLFRHAERYEGLSLATTLRDFQKREQEVRDPFLAITVRDVAKQGKRGELDVMGSWGLAAQSAMDHFRWQSERSNYRPKVAIESITWPGEKVQ